MLGEIQEYVNKNGAVSLYDLSVRFSVEETAMEKMMDLLVRKGKVNRRECPFCDMACSACPEKDCHPAKVVIYRKP